MMIFSLRIFTFVGLAAIAGCGDAGKAISNAVDANNASPGTADNIAVQVASSASRYAVMTADATSVVAVQANGDVLQRPKDATIGDPQKLGNFPIGDNVATRDEGHVALDDAFIWFASSGTGLLRMPRAGGASESVADASAEDFVILGDSVVFEGTSGILRKVDKTTKAVVDYATGFQRLAGVALDAKGDKIWIVDSEAGTVSWIPTTGTAPVTPTVVATNQPTPEQVGVGPDYVYWSNGQLGDNTALQQKLMRQKTDGTGTAEVVTDATAKILRPIMADAQYVYTGEIGGGVDRVPVTGGTLTKYLAITLADFVLTDTLVFAVENNINKYSAADRNAVNRFLAVTK